MSAVLVNPGPTRPVHRQVEPRVEQKALQQGGRPLQLERLVAAVVLQHDLGLEAIAHFLRPAEGVVDLGGGTQRGEKIWLQLLSAPTINDSSQHRLPVRSARRESAPTGTSGALMVSSMVRPVKTRMVRLFPRRRSGASHDGCHWTPAPSGSQKPGQPILRPRCPSHL